ncbi:phosphatidate cytidylyltransferase [Rhodococcus sp. RS1C4]|nr:phosphatidate cytidylyltransferase [Rhodococcus sp. RS1C4]OZC54206.1 phosphatidate cytidylyltransferase [Rhodococcus sp. 06-621-2]OZC89601.1 phosphatidate cytidylyltransferase [Rhodococcus sp. 06-418-1B]OZD05779.1 phosphatidate cytidylyltransferase [Rhodococcus sp. 06-156-4C]OZD16895.1 phosphatidate cytidylyltransferase [Rhodococcus sp. 06-156-4a]OZD26752.1 phosphatidate cytidylyltransferase [Rhodococcus sp. 06-156-3C]OZD32150.1 phosphatidate cytidylyltransferase [Rhodococcus sp. 06-156-3b
MEHVKQGDSVVAGTERPLGSAAPDPNGTGSAAAKSPGKAGRNLPAAIGVGGGLGISLILIMVFAPRVWIGVVAVALAVATYEVSKRLREAGILVPRIPLIAGGQAIIWSGWPWGTTGVLSATAATVLVCMVWLLLQQGLGSAPKNYLRELAVTVLVACWLPLLASFAVLMVLEENGAGRVLVFLIAVVCSDVGGYVAGVLFGKHPMAPAISPKKSWEGLAGSLLFCVIGSLLTVTLILDANSMIGVLLGVVLVVTGTLGDLIESQVKRDLRIKDMGTLLPGHGGIMDRLDSLLPSAFVAWLVFAILL